MVHRQPMKMQDKFTNIMNFVKDTKYNNVYQ